MYNYCTLFDSNYLTRGLAMYESLKNHSDSFHLYVFAFDDRCYGMLKKLNFKHMTVVSLTEFEDEELLKIKGERSGGEYCWTCTPSTIKFCIETYALESCTYLDADLYFFSNPTILIEEIGSKSVLITEHRYTPKYDQSATSGVYCVQFMTFKNDSNGMKVLDWWRNACNEWCYAKYEDGKFGDQKYLDDWVDRFDGIHVLKNLGGGVAPWNVQQYKFDKKDSLLEGEEIASRNSFKLIFYHFHNFKFLENDKVELGGYRLKESDLKTLYIPYIKHLDIIIKKLKHFDTYDYNGTVKKDFFSWKDPLRKLKRKFNGTYNIYVKKALLGV